MNIQEAQERIQRAKSENSTALDLSSFFHSKPLNTKDLTKLLPKINELENLTALDLRGNQISDIEVLGQLKNLSFLQIYNNPSLNLSENLKKLIDEKGKYKFLNRDEIDEIVKYYEQLKEGTDYIYEAKVLVVGEPQAGKTTLTQKTRDNDRWRKEMKGKTTESTVGVNFVTVPFPYYKDQSKEIMAHFWDFGGHKAQYVLHQYFFTESSLYVVLADGRKEFPNFNYWFKIIATLGKGCPVLVVLNENECQPIQTFNINEYRREFGAALESIEEKSVNFYQDEDGRFDSLKKEIVNKVCNLKHIGQPLPAKWVRVREDIEKLKENKAYISKDDFLEICRRHELTRRDYQQQVLDYLHILGIALNYQSDLNLRNKLILKPEWVIDALYIVLKNKEIEDAKGVFEVEYVDELWEQEGYNSPDRDILLGLMQKHSFEIAYRLGESNKFIVPILLPYKPKDYTLDEINPTQIQIDYTFMPKGILSRLIVRLNKNIVADGEQIVWNKGVLLGHHNSKAEVIESEQSKQISIKVVGDNKDHNKELLTIIRNEIFGIHRDWFDNRLKYEELVPCNCDVCGELKTKYDSLSETEEKNLSDDERKRLELKPYTLFELQDRLRKNKRTIECRKSFEDVDIYKLVQDVYIIEKKTEATMPNISISGLNGENIAVNVNAGNSGSTITNTVKQNPDFAEIEKKIDEMFSKINETQSAQINTLVDALFQKIDESRLKANKFSDEDIAKFNKAKYGNDTKLKLKWTPPLSGIIKEITGFSLEFEQELKRSQEINADWFIGKLRKINRADELNQLKLNEIGDAPKSLKS